MPQYHSSFRTSTRAAAPKHSAAQATSANAQYTANESKWWVKNFSFGTKATERHRRYQVTCKVPNDGVVSSISFDESDNASNSERNVNVNSNSRTFAVASGPRVLLYGTGASHAINRALDRSSPDLMKSITADRQISSAEGPAYCTSYRDDGRLLAFGGSNGLVRVCDTKTRATLKSFQIQKMHSKNNKISSTSTSIRAIAWMKHNPRQIVSGGDDAMLRLWDFSQDNKPVLTLSGHGDAIRSVVSLADGLRVVTGSYDHSVRVWDIQQKSCLMILDHGAPVESLLVLPGAAGFVASAGGTAIKIWDLISGRMIQETSTHSKTITSLCLAHNCGVSSTNQTQQQQQKQTRLLSAGLDGHVKVYELSTLQCLHGHKMGAPVTSVVMSKDGVRLIIGCSDGTFSVRQRYLPNSSNVNPVEKRGPMAGTYRHSMRIASANVDPNFDYTVSSSASSSTKTRKLNRFDKCLKQFRYSDALDQALATKNPESVSVVLEELAKRQGLERALSNRDEHELEPIMSFTLRYITQPKYAPLLIRVCNVLCDIYGPVLGRSTLVDDLFEKLRKHVKGEIQVQSNLLSLLGQIDTVMSVAALHNM
eukprot:CAMPEP_0116027796 /NCGR_PEP_ID=MMETSP0321-20121206/14922_1 /TAXON_ID=163516 /ORGANISM="Leptocylindrus danicus var. danicus, Strain B650" /LENGTH=592 /DNA_ID=CAMNT_0003501379 /DNA_START=29 /DNA_END=1807 /DNA_ORIENTATION=-